MKYDFDTPVNQAEIQSLKWEKHYHGGENDLICMSLADSDFQAPPILVQRMVERASKPHYGYTYRDEGFYNAVIGWYSRHTKWQIRPEWISKGYGIYPSICLVIQEFTEPGDGVIFQTPVHEVFWTIVEKNGRRAVENPLTLTGQHYQMDLVDFEKEIIENHVRLYILCSPHNPVCRVWSREELAAVSAICLKHGVLMVADEVYAPLTHLDGGFTPLASISPEVSDRTITCFAPSKAFSLTGIKDSLVIIENPDIMKRYEQALIRMNMNFGANLFGTVAIQCVLDECDDWMREQIEYVLDNRTLMSDFLQKEIPCMTLMPSESTCFAWVDCRNLNLDDEALESFFTDSARVLIRPGKYMGPGGSGFVRFMLSCPKSTLINALRNIKKAVDANA